MSAMFETDFDFEAFAPVSPELPALSSPALDNARTVSGPQPMFIPTDLLIDVDAAASGSGSSSSSSSSSRLAPLRATTNAGSSIAFRRRAKPKPTTAETAHAGPRDAFHLLSTPLHVLLQEVDELRSLEAATALQRSYDGLGKGKAPATAMWVDKYRPRRFADLLGEDRVHREVLGWLKEWDKCVFKTAGGKQRREGDEYYDALGRPRDKILLLAGAPGFGKTTLAHIVAKHAGYRPLEVNASDDRSAATVTSRIKNALDAGGGLEGRPTCVIIDEIDGATGGGETNFVKSLLRVIQDVPARKKVPARPLRRPIICICNDLYAPALRPLRQVARVVRFRKPQAQFLVRRLREVCEAEHLQADLRVLTALVDLTSGDVRSCLNTLQFIKSKSSTVSEAAIKSSAVGAKDTGTSLQTVWDALLVPMGAKQRRKQLGIDDGRYVDRLAFALQASGEYDRVVAGVFEAYPTLKPLDASFANVAKTLDWLAYYDRLSGRVNERGEYELLAYVPYAVVPWHSHFAAPSNATRQVEWPKADYEAYQARMANAEIADGLMLAVPAQLRALFSSTTALTELVPLLMRIISPPLKPVNANIVKPAERAMLARLVELMIPLGFRFWQEKTEDGQPMMRLEPAIDVFVHYDGKRAADISASRFAVRQLVAQAMDAELARRRGAAGAETTTTAASFTTLYSEATKPSTSVQDAPAAAPTDFFGRALAPPPGPAPALDGDADEPSLPAAPPAKRFRAVYKFHEGSSAAVRKSVKMRMLM
ncbi:Chromosome transmission fidelity protein 18 [Cryptotrichosporon argae]